MDNHAGHGPKNTITVWQVSDAGGQVALTCFLVKNDLVVGQIELRAVDQPSAIEVLNALGRTLEARWSKIVRP